jgi:pimeloyl-ACP methyl ester carboxylesterase
MPNLDRFDPTVALSRRTLMGLLSLCLVLPWLGCADGDSQTRTTPTSAAVGKYAPVNGLKLYYEIHGSGGTPLVMLHGGVTGSEAFGPNIPVLAKGRQVIAVHLQGHGRTKDIDRPVSFEAMADDIAGLLGHLNLKQADLLGCSLGGGTAIQFAIRHPDLLRRLVILAQPARRDGWYPELQAQFDGMAGQAAQLASLTKDSPVGKLYPDVDYMTLFTKLGALLAQAFDWTKDFAAIKAPVMLVFADADAVRPEHIVEMYKLLGGGQRDAGQDGKQRPVARLAIVPGTIHYNLQGDERVAQLVAPFLDQAALP